MSVCSVHEVNVTEVCFPPTETFNLLLWCSDYCNLQRHDLAKF